MARIQGPGELDLTELTDKPINPLELTDPVYTGMRDSVLDPGRTAFSPVVGVNPFDGVQVDLGSLIGQPLSGVGSSEAPFRTARTSDIDLSGVVAPLSQVPGVSAPVAPGTIIINPDGSIEPSGPVNTPLPGIPPGDPMVPQTFEQKTTNSETSKGTSTSTSTTEKTAGALQAERDLGEAQVGFDAAAREKQAAIDSEAKAQADLDQADQKAIMVAEAARADARAEGIAKVQQDLSEIDQKVAELTNYRPDTFWGSKSAADKVTAAISVGLGGFGAALLGSGQNVGQMLLQRQMDEFDKNSQNMYQRQIAQINGMRASLDTKMKLVDEADKVFDARKLAARAQVQGELGRALTMAKTGPVKAQIGMQVAEFDRQIANTRLENEAKYAQKVSTNETNNAVTRTTTANQILGIKERSDRVDELGKSQTKLAPIRSEIATALKQMQNPKLSDEDKIRIGQGLVKTLNSTQGSDAVGAEEAQRLARELETSYGALGKAATGGAVAGAGGGAALAGVPTLGLGAGLGAAMGGLLGGAGGLGFAAFDEMSKPGGIRFRPDIEGFTNRVSGVLQKLDGTIERQSRLQELVKRGLTIPQANRIIDQEAGL